jgi:general secretion pathway protein I
MPSKNRSFSFERILQNARGFTLLETMIAVAIMVMGFSAILMVQSSSLNTSMKAKQLNIATMLARNKMVETEKEIEGKTFDETVKEKKGEFKEPFNEYSWTQEIKEIEFPDLLGAAASSGEASGEGGENTGGPMVEKVTQMITKYLSSSIREVHVTINWKRGEGTQSFKLVTYWVDLNRDMEL